MTGYELSPLIPKSTFMSWSLKVNPNLLWSNWKITTPGIQGPWDIIHSVNE